MTTTVTMSGPGTTTIVEDTAAAVIALDATIKAQNLLYWSPTASQTPGTVPCILGGINSSLADLVVIMGNVNDQLIKLNEGMTNSTTASSKLSTGLASISGNIAQQTTIQKMQLADQLKNNEFQQKTTNQALADVGKPPTVVSPQDLASKAEAAIRDVTNINIQMKAAQLFEQTITDGFTYCWTTVYDWFFGLSAIQAVTSRWAEFKKEYLTAKPLDVAAAKVQQTTAEMFKTSTAQTRARALEVKVTPQGTPPAA